MAIQENRFKLFQRWYLTLVRIQKIFKQGEGRCCRCNVVRADDLHMWWLCPDILKFWTIVNQHIEEITAVKPPMDVRVMLPLDLDYAGVGTLRGLLAHAVC